MFAISTSVEVFSRMRLKLQLEVSHSWQRRPEMQGVSREALMLLAIISHHIVVSALLKMLNLCLKLKRFKKGAVPA
jgi:hypothetical protein